MKWFDALPVPITLATGETNAAFRALTGMEEPWPEALHLADRARVEGAVTRASTSRERVHLETHFRDGRAVRIEGAAVGDDLYALTWCDSLVEQEAATRFVAFMDHVPTVASLKDADGRYLWVNRAFETYTGLTLEELRGKTPHEWLPPERAEESLALGRSVVEKLETFEEVSSIPHEGKERVFLNTVFPVTGPNGINVGLVAKDVTELIEHEHALEYSAQLQHTVVDLGRQILRGLPDFLNVACESVSIMLGTDFTAVMEHDRGHGDIVIRAADGALRSACGTRIGLNECGVREMARHRQAIVSTDLAAERRFPMGTPALDAGARSALRVSISGDEGQYGTLATYGVTPRDFSQSEIDFLESVANMLAAAISRRSADREIAKQRQELEALIDHAPDLICRFEPDRTMSFVNDVCRLGGWDPAQLLGHRMTDIGLPPEVAEAWMDGIERVFRTGEPYTFETASGNGRHVVEVRLAPERDDQHNVVRVLGISRDITARIRAEEERTRLQEQLEQTRRAASVSRLGTTVAHEFNNVLMSISPFAEIISRSGKDDERLQKAATYIRNAIARGRRVTQDIMRYTRPAEPARRTIDVASWLPGIVQSTLQGCSALRIDVDVPAPPLYVDVDPQQLEQVVANLLINAREALADQPNGNLRIQLASGEKSLRLRIEDNGPGISPESLDKVFEPFFTTKRSGTGLGLAVAQQIVERHGGTIGVESSILTGTSFVITLPHAVAPRARPAPAVEQTIRGRQLLLVEDEVAVADGIVALLDAGAADVRVAPTGRLAVAALEHQLPEAVLLDVGLPDIDGVDLFALMRLHWPKLPIIFSTGHGDQARLEEMLRLPHVAHLVKPFDLDDLTVAVASAIAG
jgi:PAS domain S-box-containing protein